MFLSLFSQARRDTLKTALHQFLETQPQMPMGRSAEAQYAEMCDVARRMLREIAATENLAAANIQTNDKPE